MTGDVYFNELSLHGQFQSYERLHQSLLSIRQVRAQGVPLLVSRETASRHAFRGKTLLAAIEDPKLRRDILIWITNTGPLWQEAGDRHPGDMYLEAKSEPVTDTGLGEAAFRALASHAAATFSLRPSDWEHSPIRVVHRIDDRDERSIEVTNFVESKVTVEWFREQQAPPQSWNEMLLRAMERFARLRFGDGVIRSLVDHPFVPGAAKSIIDLLSVLHQLAEETHKSGRTDKGAQLYDSYFARKNAWFTDSSDPEKQAFRTELTFKHPVTKAAVFAPWHGKVQTPQLRVHFVYPLVADQPVFVVYIGPKITKK